MATLEPREIEELKAARRELHDRKLMPWPELQKEFVVMNVFSCLLGSGVSLGLMYLALLPVEDLLGQLPGQIYLILTAGLFVSSAITFFISARQSAGICGAVVKLCNTMRKAEREEDLEFEDCVFRNSDLEVFHRISVSLRALFSKFGVKVNMDRNLPDRLPDEPLIK